MKYENQFDLNQKTKRFHFLIRLKNGIVIITKQPWRILFFCLGLGFLLYLCSILIPEDVIWNGLSRPFTVMLSFVWIIMFLLLTGTPLKARKVSDELRRIGLTNEAEYRFVPLKKRKRTLKPF